MKKIAILAMAIMFAGAVCAQDQTTKKEPVKTEKKCCAEKKCDKKDEKKSCCEKKDGKKCDKKAEKKSCCEKKADAKK